MFFSRSKTQLVTADNALPGRATPLPHVPEVHAVNGNRIQPPFPDGLQTAVFGGGCFWGVEKVFWEDHDPTQGMRQGNDVGTQYRSAIYTQSAEQEAVAKASKDAFQERLTAAGYGEITTEILPLGEFYYAEDYHQQYLSKVPNGYCPINSTGVAC